MIIEYSIFNPITEYIIHVYIYNWKPHKFVLHTVGYYTASVCLEFEVLKYVYQKIMLILVPLYSVDYIVFHRSNFPYMVQ